MYKVVLIDDESIITEGLQKVVDWTSHSCQVAALAQDAATGVETIRKYRPDILFTDIKMPGEDGLTMLAALKGEFPRMQIAVLTGYRDFEYARRAIRLGVSRFLLKPSKMDELNEALEHMTGVLDRLPPPEAPEAKAEADDSNSFLVRQAQTYIAKNCARRLSLQDVADHCYVSQWHLSKLLNKHLNQSFYDLLNTVRVRQAKELMADPALRISEVAEQVGYADTAHFSRVFKKLEGVSAGEWRNLHCGKDKSGG
ncbi:MAG: response regulator [Acetatifactor sp.]|nr:response regulator [Acetatifactor sp.]